MKFLVSGYYGFDNLGDEAILAVLVDELRREFPEAELVVLSNRPAETARIYGVRAINRWSAPKILRELWDATLFISGGGGLIQDRSSRRSAIYYLGLLRIAQRFCPVALIGQGIGPLRSRWLQGLAKWVLRQVDLAYVRDEPSGDFLHKSGLKNNQVIVGSDLTLLTQPKWASFMKTSQNPSALRKLLGLSLSGKISQQFSQELAKQLDQVYAKLGLQSMLIAFHQSQDRKNIEGLQTLMKTPALIVEPPAKDFTRLAECLSETRFVLGMRFHSIIFSLMAARPPLAIMSDPKLERIAKQIRENGGPEIPSWTQDQIESGGMNLVEHIKELEASYELSCKALEQASEALYVETVMATQKTWKALSVLAESQARKS